MTSWMKERDLLVEQTLAFVRGVAAAHPIRVAAPARSTIETADGVLSGSPSAASQIAGDAPARVVKPMPAADGAALITPERPIDIAGRSPPQPMLRTIVSERDDIMQRVAAFRAHQTRLIRERESYYETMQARIQQVLARESADRPR